MVPIDRSSHSDHEEHVTVLAHGLLNPMAVVVGGIDVALADEALDDPTREALESSRRQALAVTEFLRQLAQGLPPEVVSGAAEITPDEP